MPEVEHLEGNCNDRKYKEKELGFGGQIKSWLPVVIAICVCVMAYAQVKHGTESHETRITRLEETALRHDERLDKQEHLSTRFDNLENSVGRIEGAQAVEFKEIRAIMLELSKEAAASNAKFDLINAKLDDWEPAEEP
jgi:hypothetical protein